MYNNKQQNFKGHRCKTVRKYTKNTSKYRFEKKNIDIILQNNVKNWAINKASKP